MLLLDRSCVIVGKFVLKYYVPQQWHPSQVYAYMLYARVEHKELCAIIVILLTSMSYFDSAVLLDEAAQTDIHDRVHETGSTNMLRTQVASGCMFLQL